MEQFPVEITYHRLAEWLNARSSVHGKRADYAEVRDTAVQATQLVRHEMAGWKKLIQKAKRSAAEAEKREKGHMQSVARLQAELRDLEAGLGISGVQPAQHDDALRAHATLRLQSHHDTVSAALSELGPALQAFETLTASTALHPIALGHLSFASQHGVAHPPAACTAFLETGAVPTAHSDSAAAAPSADIPLPEAPQDSVGVRDADWDLLMVGGEQGAVPDEADAWEVTEVAAGDLAEEEAPGQTVLTDKDSRTLLVDDLWELICFLKQRVAEGDVACSPHLGCAEHAASLLGDAAVEELLLLCASGPHRVTALQDHSQKAAELQRVEALLQRDRDSIVTLTLQQAEASEEIDRITPRAREMRTLLETRLSAWHEPRSVVLVGDISHL